ncbi:GNAT family N-acetyltransferase [Actinomadura rayongensis]|uniref:GNAT family N-acetyltransferase n=1 Tax=Actinomadura rayongensis TaxID=1429076 RepID=UPI00301D6F6F
MTGVEVRMLRGLAEFADVRRLFETIWQPDPGGDPAPVELLAALAHTGNYVAGAYRDGRLVGASAGFLADPPGTTLHSHVTGTIEPGAGFALKVHQREWALERGLTRITWTFDPLVRRNAYFNLGKLGARATEYLPSFYGPVRDAINRGDETDRLLVEWPLGDPRVADAVAGRPPGCPVPPGTPVVLGERVGLPARGRDGSSVMLVAIPDDIEALRRTDPLAARAWRRMFRETLGGLLAEGGHVAGIHHRSHYVVERPSSREVR